MKSFFKFIGVLLLLVFVGFGFYWYFYLRKTSEPVSLINLKTTLYCDADNVEV